MDESRDDLEPEAADIEITDIPLDEGRSVSPIMLKLSSILFRFSPGSRTWRLATVVGTLGFVLLVLLGNSQYLLTTAQELFNKPPLQEVVGAQEQIPVLASPLRLPLGPAPQSCPSIAVLRNFDHPTFSPGVGSSPVWIVGFSGPGARLVQLDSTVRQPQAEGWAYRLTLVVSSDYAGFVVLSGASLQDNVSLMFDNGISIATQDPITTFFLLHTNHPLIPIRQSDTHWRAWSVPVYLPMAGCYYLRAAWLTGSWQVNFTAGR